MSTKGLHAPRTPDGTTVPRVVRSRPLSWWWLLLLVFALVAIALFANGTGGPQALPPPVSVTSSTTPLADVATTHFLTRSQRLVVRIPTLGVRARIINLDLARDGTVQVPNNIVDVGWYDRGPTPGQVGNAVLLGHVDSFRGPGVFFALRTLVAGDRITVTRADAHVATFVVTTVRQYAKTMFPDQLVYGNHGVSALILVTCGGVFNRRTGHYESNVVVSSVLSS